MVEKSEVKPETLLNFEDLLQCPVCYEIPSGQIFQCNEGHHVCGRCKMRLDVCPVCRALFFGTRNYAMEELISNFKQMRSLKIGSKASGSGSSESSTPAKESTAVEQENDTIDDEDEEGDSNTNAIEQSRRPPAPCKGLFRCLCCKTGKSSRLPSARLLNHLRYFHAPDLLEGHSENGEYLQAWQFATVPGKLVTAVRISDMGIFYLTIEITPDTLHAWLSMAAAQWVAHEFSYTITVGGNDREAIFSDCVWSVKSCEGTLKKRGYCLFVNDTDAQALTVPSAISGKLSVRRTPSDQLTVQSQPRTVLRIASRVNNQNAAEMDPVLQELENDVARLSRAFATLGREASALMRSEAQMRSRVSDMEHAAETSAPANRRTADAEEEPPSAPHTDEPALSRNARKRLKQRMRAALESLESADGNQPSTNSTVARPTPNTTANQPRQNTTSVQPRQNTPAVQPTQTTPVTQPRQCPSVTQPRQNSSASQPRQNGVRIVNGFNVVAESTPEAPPPVFPSSSGAQSQQPQNGNANRNKKKRRHRR